jgi:cytochrome c biogenesis protein
MKFYQATYQERPDQSRAVMSILDTKTGEKKDLTVTPETPFSLGDGSVRYTVVNYQPNFGELGPAVQVVREEGPLSASAGQGADAVAGDTKSTNFWVFSKYPDFDKDYRGDRFALTFDKLEPMYVTGIQVGYDPGVPWIYFGCFLMWAGLFVTFWTVHRRLWARVEDGRVVLAGAAHRNKERFAQEFEGLVEKLGLPAKRTRP